MPKYVKYQKPGMGTDIPRVPWRIGNFNEISFDGGKTWVSPSPYMDDQRYVGLFRGSFSVRKKAAASAQHWIGFSPSFPTQSGHTYICTFEVRNVLSAISYGRLITSKSASDTSFDITSYPLTANQTEYTRVWHTFVQSSEGTGRAYIDACPAVAGTDIQLDIRDLRYVDVTGIDSSKYTSIGNQDWYAVRTSLDAIVVKAGEGITRAGNTIALNTATKDELAGGVARKAVTPDKLKSWISDGNSYKVKDSQGNDIYLQNLVKDYTTATLTPSAQSSDAQSAVFGDIRSIWGTINGTLRSGGMYYDNANVVRDQWIGQDPSGRKYIVSADFRNETPVAGSKVILYLTMNSNGAGDLVSGTPKETSNFMEWTHVALLLNATNIFSIMIEVYNVAQGGQIRASFKNLAIYDVTDIPSTYYPIIAAGKVPLLQGKYPVLISGESISFHNASVADVIDGTVNTSAIVNNDTLNRVLDVGGIADIGIEPNKNSFTVTKYQETINGVLEDCIQLTKTNPTANSYYYYTWNPPPFMATGKTYLFMADVSNRTSAAILASMRNEAWAVVVTISGVAYQSTIPAYSGTVSWTRMAGLTRASASGGFFIYYENTANLDIRLAHLKLFDVTGLTDDDIKFIATMPHPEDIYYHHLIKYGSVSPIQEIIDVASAPTVVVNAGRAYRLTATGTHTISVGEYRDTAVGEDTYIQIITNNSSIVQVGFPIRLMGAIRANAVNNCIIKYINGSIKMFVEDIDQGYVVTLTNSQEDGSVYYGLKKTLDGTVEYITFSESTNNKSISVDGAVAVLNKAVSVIGNDKEMTNISFGGGITGTTQTFKISCATVTDLTWINGPLELSEVGLGGAINVTGGTISFSGLNDVAGTITTDVGLVLTNNCTLRGDDAIIIGRNTYIYNNAKTNLSLSNLTIRNVCFENSSINLAGVKLYRETAHGVALGALLIRSNLTIVDCYLDGGGGTIIHSDSNYTEVTETTFANGTAFVGGSPATIRNCTFTNTAYFGYIGYGQKKTLINNRNLPNISSYSGSGSVPTGVLVFDQYNGLIGKFTPTIAGCTVCITPNSTLDLRGNANAAAISGVVLIVGTVNGNTVTASGSAKIITKTGASYTVSGSGTYLNTDGTTNLTRS